MANIFKKIYNSKPMQAYIRGGQKVLVTIMLFLLYYIGAFFTLILILLFKRSMLNKKPPDENSYWHDAKDYKATIENSLQQS